MLNEKTLELNITHELLDISRRYDRGAFAFGTTLIRESYVGYDSRILGRIPHSWVASPKQFKRAKRRRHIGRNQFVYIFDINNNTYNDQHLILYYHLAGGRRNVAFYALPAIYTQSEFNNALPHLLNHTFHVDVADILPHWVDSQKHQIYLYPHLRMARIHSKKERKIRVLSSEEFIGLVAEKRIGATISVILENMKRPTRGNFVPKSKRPRFLFSIFPGVSERREMTRLEAVLSELS